MIEVYPLDTAKVVAVDVVVPKDMVEVLDAVPNEKLGVDESVTLEVRFGAEPLNEKLVEPVEDVGPEVFG